MDIGEKIKHFRSLRHLSQEQLALQSGIGLSTIAKYEMGLRKPKPDQLVKLSEALGISINVFLDFDIKTVSDLLSLLFKMDEQLDMRITAEHNGNGEYIPESVSLSFDNNVVNSKLCIYIAAKDKFNELISSNQNLTNPAYAFELQLLEKNISDLTVRLIDDNTVITKNSSPTPTAEVVLDTSINEDLYKEIQMLFADSSPSEFNFMLQMLKYMKICLREDHVDFSK